MEFLDSFKKPRNIVVLLTPLPMDRFVLPSSDQVSPLLDALESEEAKEQLRQWFANYERIRKQVCLAVKESFDHKQPREISQNPSSEEIARFTDSIPDDPELLRLLAADHGWTLDTDRKEGESK